MADTAELLDIIESRKINTHFQPIIGSQGEGIFAYEALTVVLQTAISAARFVCLKKRSSIISCLL